MFSLERWAVRLLILFCVWLAAFLINGLLKWVVL